MGDDFLSRWSRRKREAEDAPEEDAAPVEPASGPSDEAVPEESDAEVLARLGLKHPEDMEAGDDFAAFLRAAVPGHLKSIAYRRLWRSDPTLACLDGLNDYDGDFTATGVPEGGLRTSYEVGRGILRKVAEFAEEQAAEVPEEPAVADTHDEIRNADPGESDSGNQTESGDIAESVQQNDTPGVTRRRMVFRPKA